MTLTQAKGRFTYASLHLHTRGGQVGTLSREVKLVVDGSGRVEGSQSVPQALWLWRGPPSPGCVTGREELTGREGPHCVTAVRGRQVEGTLLGTAFRASYSESGKLEVLEVGDSRFSVAAAGERLRAPPELFAQGVPVEGETGALAFEPPWPVPERLPGMTPWEPRAARALAERVGMVHGLLVVDGGPARPHAWVRVALASGGVLELDPTSLDAVSPQTHLPLALVDPAGSSVEAGERWVELLRGTHRVVRRP